MNKFKETFAVTEMRILLGAERGEKGRTYSTVYVHTAAVDTFLSRHGTQCHDDRYDCNSCLHVLHIEMSSRKELWFVYSRITSIENERFNNLLISDYKL